jgi:hypothetical protein
MKIDYEIIKKYLTVFHGHEKPLINTRELFDKLNFDLNNQRDVQEAYHYINLLNDQNLIECVNGQENIGFILLANGLINVRISNYRLTHFGHQTYEAMNSSIIWKKINGALKKLGESGIKQIPTLALKLLTE